jgi:hypothetical protein
VVIHHTETGDGDGEQGVEFSKALIEELYPPHWKQTPSLNTGLASVLWSRIGYNACPSCP